jgi:hypothetical protein
VEPGRTIISTTTTAQVSAKEPDAIASRGDRGAVPVACSAVTARLAGQHDEREQGRGPGGQRDGGDQPGVAEHAHRRGERQPERRHRDPEHRVDAADPVQRVDDGDVPLPGVAGEQARGHGDRADEHDRGEHVHRQEERVHGTTAEPVVGGSE